MRSITCDAEGLLYRWNRIWSGSHWRKWNNWTPPSETYRDTALYTAGLTTETCRRTKSKGTQSVSVVACCVTAGPIYPVPSPGLPSPPPAVCSPAPQPPPPHIQLYSSNVIMFGYVCVMFWPLDLPIYTITVRLLHSGHSLPIYFSENGYK